MIKNQFLDERVEARIGGTSLMKFRKELNIWMSLQNRFQCGGRPHPVPGA